MSNASLGEPLSRQHGVALYSAEVTYGTAVTPATAIGAGSFTYTLRNNNRFIRTLGSQDYVAVKGGEAITEWSVELPEVQTGAKTFLLKAQRVSGVVPSITLGLGYQDDVTPTPNRSAAQIAGAKIETLRLSLEAGPDRSGPLSATVSGFGRVPTTLTTLAPAVLSTTGWAAYEGVFTKDTDAYQLRSFDLTLTNNIRRDYVIPGEAPASNVRGPAYLSEQERTIEGTLTRYEVSGVDVQADCPAEFDMSLVLTNTCDETTLTLAFTDVIFGDEERSMSDDGWVVTIPFTAKSLVMS